MDICRLCLQPGSQIIQNTREIRGLLKNFLPYTNTSLRLENLKICDICLQNIDVYTSLNTSLNQTNQKIESQMKNSTQNLIDLSSLIRVNLDKTQSVCRVCLNVVSDPQIFLCENDTNIFRHDLILSMFKFCKLLLNCDLSEKPIMCLQCWENLQVCYSFKKNILETDGKMRAYCNLFKISAKNMTDEIIEQMGRYFLEQSDGIHTDIALMIKKEIFCNGINDNKGYALRKKIKKENEDTMPDLVHSDEMPQVKIKGEGKRTQKRRHRYTNEEGEFLLKSYLKTTQSTSQFSSTPWKKIQKEWNSNFSTHLTTEMIALKIKRMLKSKQSNLFIQTPDDGEIPPPNEEKRLKNIFTPSHQESDDSYIYKGEIARSSFAPRVKPEPLGDDDEIHTIESEFVDIPPSETESDNESLPLPLLERMDLPPLKFKIENVYSVDVKREEISEMNHQCPVDQNFDGQFNNVKKGFECEHCSFVTSKYFLLKHHLATCCHEENGEDDEIPVLVPFT